MTDVTSTLVEEYVRNNIPDGFQTTLTDADRLRELENVSHEGIIDDVVDDYSDETLTERNVIDYEVNRIMSSFLTPERTMELPGTALEYYTGRLYSFAAAYKQSDDTPTGTIKDIRRAQSDDLVFTPITPAVINMVAGNEPGDPGFVDNFMIEGASAGDEVVIIGQDGFNSDTEAKLELDDNERMFFTGDTIDLTEGKSVLTRTEWVQVDGKSEDYGPIDQTLDKRLSGARLGLGNGAYVKRDGELHARIYEDGDLEPYPVGFYMGPGSNTPDL